MKSLRSRLTEPNGIAARLFAIREQAGLTGVQLAARLGCSESKISRIQSGQRPTPKDIEGWTTACGRPDLAEELKLKLDTVLLEHHAWGSRMSQGQKAVQDEYGEIFKGAEFIAFFDTAFIPGPLQTPEYAKRVLTEMRDWHQLEIDDVDAAVASRIERQTHLYKGEKHFKLLAAESALRWVLPTVPVMQAQLDRLQSVIGLPKVEFGVLPMGVPMPFTPQNSFQIYDDIAITETFHGEDVHRGENAAAYRKALEILWSLARTGEDARPLITEARRALDP